MILITVLGKAGGKLNSISDVVNVDSMLFTMLAIAGTLRKMVPNEGSIFKLYIFFKLGN